jgi:glutaminyl-peptide cyclotransferase
MVSSIILFAAALQFTPADATLAFDTAKGLVEGYTPRDAGTIRSRLAANYLLDAASATGADVRRDVFTASTPKGDRQFVNLYATFRNGGEDSKWVVLISHYDTKSGVKCPGANDGASTSGLLVGIANAFSRWERPKGNLCLIWTDGEECMFKYSENDGLWGSKRAAKFVAESLGKVQAVICLDMLGDRDLSVSIPANGTPALAKIAMHAARRTGHGAIVNPIKELVKDDHDPFLANGFNAIDLIDFSYGPDNSYWHTEKDSIDNISVKSLQTSGEIVVEMMKILL